MTSDVTQEETDKVYDHILQSLQQGRQPGTYRQMGEATGVHYRRIGGVISSLCLLDQLVASRPDKAAKYSPLQYDIPGYDFPSEPAPKEDVNAEDRRLASEAMKQMRSLHRQGFTIPEISKMVPEHIDGSGWDESSIAHVINRTQPNYSGMLKSL